MLWVLLMAIALRGAAWVPAANPTTGFTCTIDAAVAAGDILWMVVTSRDSTSGSANVTCTDNDSGGNTWTTVANTADKKAWVFSKRATSATASKTITIANCVGSASGVGKAFSGVSSGATWWSNVVNESNVSGNETHAGFTPTYKNSMLVASVHNYANDNAVTSLSFATAGATTMTEKLSTGGLDCATAFGHVLQSGGPTGSGNLTWAQTDGTTYSYTLALIPNETVTATAPTVTVTAPAAARTASVTLTAAAPTVTLSAPAGTVVADGGGTSLQATAPVITLSAPTATRLAQSTLTAGAPTMTTTAPAGTAVPGAVALAAGAPMVVLSAPAAVVITGGGGGGGADPSTLFGYDYGYRY